MGVLGDAGWLLYEVSLQPVAEHGFSRSRTETQSRSGHLCASITKTMGPTNWEGPVYRDRNRANQRAADFF